MRRGRDEGCSLREEMRIVIWASSPDMARARARARARVSVRARAALRA